MDWRDEMRKKLADAGVEMLQSLDSAKEFTLKYTFTDVSKIVDGRWKHSPIEYHFGVPWYILIKHVNDHLEVYLHCERKEENTPWSIQCALQLDILHPSGKTESRQLEYIYQEGIGRGRKEFLKWEEMKKEYLVQNQLTVLAHVTIKSMIGFQ
uniref:MATH domain-containing protein n=1 Tax=Caenorhabditis tropicalis TaxID=1561998 RepID=A0A1I7T5D2_9PELO